MATATLTSKGQVTIPKAVCQSLNLRTEDRIEFVVHRTGEALLRPDTQSVDEVFGKFHDADQPVLAVKDMDAAIAEHVRRQDP